jgi:hypothetical protein
MTDAPLDREKEQSPWLVNFKAKDHYMVEARKPFRMAPTEAHLARERMFDSQSHDSETVVERRADGIGPRPLQPPLQFAPAPSPLIHEKVPHWKRWAPSRWCCDNTGLYQPTGIR